MNTDETKIMGLKLLLTKMGVECDFEYIPPEKMKQLFTDNGWHDPTFLDMYEKAYTVLSELKNSLPGYGE